MWKIILHQLLKSPVLEHFKKRRKFSLTKLSPSPGYTISNLPSNQPVATTKNLSTSPPRASCGPEFRGLRNLIRIRFISSLVGSNNRPHSYRQGQGMHHEDGNSLQAGEEQERLRRRNFSGQSGGRMLPGGSVQVLSLQQRRGWE